VVLLSNWIIHGTYQTNTMKLGRMNAEVRFMGENIDIVDPDTGEIGAPTRPRVRELLPSWVRQLVFRFQHGKD